ncbi:MAG: glycosyltransferase N-terminal domain-containing protein, partial [Pseudomonadota bacterium]
RGGHSAALINARMTEKSIVGWGRWPRTAERVFSSFDVIAASDLRTKTGLTALSKKPVALVGNLKSALPPPAADETELLTLRAAIGERPVLVAASTHDGEEAIIIDTLLRMSPRPFAIIAPRHPERGDWVASLLDCTALNIARRSDEEPIRPDTDVLLADTLGEMGLWYRLADTVYLGGGHAPGVGGHNPMEPLRLGKPVLTGPSLFNFQDMSEDLLARGLIRIVETPNDIAEAFPAPPVAKASLAALEQSALDPMSKTLALLAPFLEPGQNST